MRDPGPKTSAGLYLKFFTKIVFQVAFHQNSDISKLCPASSCLNGLVSICLQIFPLKFLIAN